MKLMQYIVLLNLFVAVSSMHAMDKKSKHQPKIEFPIGRVHRFVLRDRERATKAEHIEQFREEIRKEAREEAAKIIATKEVKELVELLDKQVDEEAAKIIATIDQSTLEALDLEGLD